MKYFDYAATTPLDSQAAQTFVEVATKYYGNTGSLHDIGSTAKDLLENCRQEFSNLLGASKDGVFFTSGGSESNHLGIHALLSAKKKEGFHIISSIAEHSSIRSTLDSLSLKGYEVTLLPLNEEGQIELESVKKATREDTVLIAIQHGNSEIGSLQPIEDIGKWCQNQKILLHSDCVHTFGKIDLRKLVKVVDSLSLSSHKFYGPKGVGAVYVNPKLAWKPHYPGTTHENGFRPGTVNVPAIVAMTVAAQHNVSQQQERFIHAEKLRQLLLSMLDRTKEPITIYGGVGVQQLPHTLGLRLHGLEGQWVMLECNRLGFAISTGSACQTGLTSPSKTMMAMNIPDKIGKEFVRISFGYHTTEQDVTALGEALIRIIHK
ncbi:IscS subfamily cysteine desulfurase [Bacillus sp. V3B]|uniref:IscS subfamily cysteine desulfurase n=1 Tax=Bacillus sp. V3B TaxID=2804915 RepID=UPI00210C5B0A|nr:IscS subfamily cysteine desulfurase [Bacillus sp. V3B]MCQ6273541.1 IscS subfamily cysteine desulfurase [Bacillus sp. V3B]